MQGLSESETGCLLTDMWVLPGMLGPFVGQLPLLRRPPTLNVRVFKSSGHLTWSLKRIPRTDAYKAIACQAQRHI